MSETLKRVLNFKKIINDVLKLFNSIKNCFYSYENSTIKKIILLGFSPVIIWFCYKFWHVFIVFLLFKNLYNFLKVLFFGEEAIKTDDLKSPHLIKFCNALTNFIFLNMYSKVFKKKTKLDVLYSIMSVVPYWIFIYLTGYSIKFLTIFLIFFEKPLENNVYKKRLLLRIKLLKKKIANRLIETLKKEYIG